jgi:hypothetical protein
MSRKTRPLKGFSLLEIMVSASIFVMILLAMFQGLGGTYDSMRHEADMNSAQGGATIFIDRLGRDIRESSYAYIYAGDWYVSPGVDGVSITVARNYFSSNPLFGGTTLVPGIFNEGWGQCMNPICSWCTRQDGSGMVPNLPMAFMARPIRNNAQSGSPLYPPPSFQFSTQDARGRLFSHLSPGASCPECRTLLSPNAFFGGLLLFSPRKKDGSFSYIDKGDEVQWESMVFYCPFRWAQGGSEIRRYVFYASSIDSNASLTDLLDFDGDEIIESPPMTDTFGDFVLDAEAEFFCLAPSVSGNMLMYAKWDTMINRSFRITVNRTSGVANVIVVGGPYGGGGIKQVQLKMDRYARGLSDLDVSTFLNNPSWESAGTIINPTGVAELGVVRITFQVDRLEKSGPEYLESVQTIKFRPRN